MATGLAAHDTRASAVHGATPIWRTSAVGGEFAGPMYFRKVFYVPHPTTVTFTALADDSATIQLNGSSLLNVTAWGNPAVYTTRSLPAGCHILTAKVINNESSDWGEYGDSRSDDNAAALLVSARDAAGKNLTLTDTSWRFWSPGGAHYTSRDYFNQSAAWTNSRDLGQVLSAGTPWDNNPSNWGSVAGDEIARYMASPWGYNIAGTHASTWNYPHQRWIHFRTELSITAPDARIYMACDDSAYVYLNGAHVGTCHGSAGVQTFALNLQGDNVLGISVYNNGTTPSPTMVVASVYSAPGGSLIRRSDAWWQTTRPTLGSGGTVISLGENRPPPAVSNSY